MSVPVLPRLLKLDPGDTLDEFTIFESLEPGKSKTAKVYKAHQDAVIKLFTADKARGDYEIRYEKFTSEAEIIRKLEQSEYVVNALTEFRENGIHNSIEKNAPYYATELMDGNLEDYIISEKLTLSVKIEILIQVMQGLNDVHTAEVGHRDIWTPNILYKVDSGKINCKLADFGSAKENGKPQNQPYNIPLGNLYYTSPEASVGMLGGDDPDFELVKASDIFAVGMVMFEILTAREQTSLRSGLAAIYHIACQRGITSPGVDETDRVKFLNEVAIPLLDASTIEEITTSDILADEENAEDITGALNGLFKEMIVFNHKNRNCNIQEHIDTLKTLKSKVESSND